MDRKRAFDLVLALIGVAIFALPMLAIAVLLLLFQGRPVFYRAERMATPDRAFLLWKFRTMRVNTGDSCAMAGVTGGDKGGRITALGRGLRRLRLDEAPQLWNILRGDMSFVGPRPPLRIYVDRFPTLYAKVLRNRPGLTGLSTLAFFRHEPAILGQCATAQQTDAVYVRRCIARKARLDLIYQEKRTVWLDIQILGRSFSRVFS